MDLKTPPPAPRRSRFPVGILVRLVVGGVLLAIVFHGVALEEVLRAVHRADGVLVVAAFAMNWSGVLFSVSRWRTLLRAQGGDAPHGVLARSFLVGQFFNNLLPSTIGGDAVRTYDSVRFGLSHGAAVTTIIVDRLLGLATLAAFALASATLLSRPSISTQVLALALFAAGALATVTVWLILAPPSAVLAMLAGLPVGFRRRIQVLGRQLGDALIRFHRNPWALVRGILISIVLQVSVIVFYAVLGAALGFQVPFLAWFLIVPIAVLAMLAPVSINAIGVREGVFAFLLASYGVSKAGAVAFAWLAYSSVALQAVLGAAFYVARARRGEKPRRLSGGWAGARVGGLADGAGEAGEASEASEAGQTVRQTTDVV